MPTKPDFSDLKALFINCSIKKDKTKSHTQLLMNKAAYIMTEQGVAVEHIYALDHAIAFGMIKDGIEEGQADEWPAIQAKILDSTYAEPRCLQTNLPGVQKCFYLTNM